MTDKNAMLSSFRAEIADETIKHRGADEGLVAAFIGKVRKHQQRYLTKIVNLRAENPGSDFDDVEGQITRLADEAISAAKSAGRVDLAA